MYAAALLFLPAAFFAWGCALIDHSGWPEFKRKMRVDFLPTLTAEVTIRPIVQSVNFSVVPLQHHSDSTGAACTAQQG